jgi:hypothetical protein
MRTPSRSKALIAYIGTLGTQRVSAGGQLGASGSGTITISRRFLRLADTGFCHVKTSGGSTREIVYYSSRTGTVLTVPTAGRGLLGTSRRGRCEHRHARRGAGDPHRQGSACRSSTTGNAQTIANEGTAPSGITWSYGHHRGDRRVDRDARRRRDLLPVDSPAGDRRRDRRAGGDAEDSVHVRCGVMLNHPIMRRFMRGLCASVRTC